MRDKYPTYDPTPGSPDGPPAPEPHGVFYYAGMVIGVLVIAFVVMALIWGLFWMATNLPGIS